MASLFPRLHCIIALPIAIVLPIDSTAFHTGISPIKGAENMKMRSDMSARNCLLFFFLDFFSSLFRWSLSLRNTLKSVQITFSYNLQF